MSDSAYLVGAFLLRNNTDSGGIAAVDDDAVSRFVETTRCFGMKPPAEILPDPVSEWTEQVRDEEQLPATAS